MKFLKKIFFLVIIAFCGLSFNIQTGYAFGNSTYESHHIFPQKRGFDHLGDESCFQLTEFEHRWVEYSGGFKGDWENFENGILSRKGDFTEDSSTISNYGMRCAAYVAGKRILSYHLFTVDHNSKNGDGDRSISGLLATKFDFWGNIFYNLGYIMGIPAKLIHFWIYALPQHDSFYGQPSVGYLIFWGIKETILGLIQAVIMLFIGPIIGLIMHPLWSLGGLLFSTSNPILVNGLSTACWLIGVIVGPIVNIVIW